MTYSVKCLNDCQNNATWYKSNCLWFYDKTKDRIERSNVTFGADENTSCTYETYKEVDSFRTNYLNKQ